VKFHYHGNPITSTKGELIDDFSKEGGSPDSGLYERQDDWSSCVYFYLDKPENELPEIDSLKKRIV
jgi:hypothetical protein